MSNISSSAFADTKAHYDLLDGLRGVAALMVIWYHVFEGYAFAGGGNIETLNHGYLAVDFFFILSGFVIGYAYDDRWGKSLTMKDFFKRRLIRLHPMVVMGAVLGAILKVAFAVIVVYLVYTGASTCYDYGYRIFTEPAISSGEGRKITVTLTSDMSATEIGNTLQEKGLVRDGRLFALQYLLSEYKKDWKPGTYELSTAMTAEEMMEVMAGQTESATEETVETIDNGSAITGETQDTTAVAQ